MQREPFLFDNFCAEFRSSMKISLATHIADLEVAKWWLI
jgi:hypothetical protein